MVEASGATRSCSIDRLGEAIVQHALARAQQGDVFQSSQGCPSLTGSAADLASGTWSGSLMRVAIRRPRGRGPVHRPRALRTPRGDADRHRSRGHQGKACARDGGLADGANFQLATDDAALDRSTSSWPQRATTSVKWSCRCRQDGVTAFPGGRGESPGTRGYYNEVFFFPGERRGRSRRRACSTPCREAVSVGEWCGMSLGQSEASLVELTLAGTRPGGSSRIDRMAADAASSPSARGRGDRPAAEDPLRRATKLFFVRAGRSSRSGGPFVAAE